MQKYALAFRVFAVTAAAGLLIPIIASAAILRNLKFGDRGTDVKELQQILNKDPDTRITASGAGSPGNETEYFGALTFTAVKKLQQKYASEVLTPIGLTAPTGFVGEKTRLLLSRLGSTGISLPPPQPAPPVASLKAPTITAVTPTVITHMTETLTISGTGFLPSGNTVKISSEGPNAFENLPSSNGTVTLSFSPSVAKTLNTALDKFRTAGNYETVARIVLASVQERLPGYTDSIIPLILTVENQNGVSAPAQFQLNLSAILLKTQ